MREYSIGISRGLDPVLPDEQIDRLTAAGIALSLDKDAYLYHQGEPANKVYLLVSGRVNTFLVSSNGQESLLRIHLPGSLLGLTAMASRPVRDASAIAVEASETVSINAKTLSALQRTDPELGACLIQLLLDRMSDFHYRVGELLCQTVEQRLSRALLALSQKDCVGGETGETAEVTLTHEQFAHLLNTRRPTVSAALGRLARAGFIARNSGAIVITDRDGLARFAQEHKDS